MSTVSCKHGKLHGQAVGSRRWGGVWVGLFGGCRSAFFGVAEGGRPATSGVSPAGAGAALPRALSGLGCGAMDSDWTAMGFMVAMLSEADCSIAADLGGELAETAFGWVGEGAGDVLGQEDGLSAVGDYSQVSMTGVASTRRPAAEIVSPLPRERTSSASCPPQWVLLQSAHGVGPGPPGGAGGSQHSGSEGTSDAGDSDDACAAPAYLAPLKCVRGSHGSRSCG
ncbi:hypothetical protein OEZ85_002513 [Tetradesmus obliquus]|uniref:Uncharacterized protein n=1 Tax=Tetradesmus obliquus TaxID=3088 RepID=A0ABY8TZZ5_TETOB|nr:hypothetical protein OEZ85_002513 [Tetradesmus obliquus]